MFCSQLQRPSTFKNTKYQILLLKYLKSSWYVVFNFRILLIIKLQMVFTKLNCLSLFKK
jgi:hypothetical protein